MDRDAAQGGIPMKQLRGRTQKPLQGTAHASNRREANRLPTEFGLMYSAEDPNRELIIGDGKVTDLSRTGLGIRGTTAVTPGMVLTLFLYLPDGQDPLFVVEARVAWSTGHRFGVHLLKMNLRELNRLHYFLRINRSL
jgi:PilZ domain